jgi:alanine racemase
LADNCGLGLVVKSNAYGHGLPLTVLCLSDLADLFIVHTLDEALEVRALAPQHRVLMVGPLPPHGVRLAQEQGIELTVVGPEYTELLRENHLPTGRRINVHLKIETGTHRQGMGVEDALDSARALAAEPAFHVRAVSTHFADIEDTLDHSFAHQQHQRFQEAVARFESAGFTGIESHCANSAATLLWPTTHRTFVRSGISLFGMWPSRETWLSTQMATEDGVGEPELRPALRWTAQITSIQNAEPGAFVGYGRSYRCTEPRKIGVVSVGYAEGYDRGLSNHAYVLKDGVRLPVIGRVCMNLIMVDLSPHPGASIGDEVVLLGQSDDENLSAEQMGSWLGTINYEVTTRIAAEVPRIATDIPEELQSVFQNANIEFVS